VHDPRVGYSGPARGRRLHVEPEKLDFPLLIASPPSWCNNGYISTSNELEFTRS
jgi:hypothetical protein